VSDASVRSRTWSRKASSARNSGAGQHLCRVELVQLSLGGGRGVGVVERDVELPGRHVGEGEAVGVAGGPVAPSCPASLLADDSREVLGRIVGRFEEGAGRDDAGYLPGVAVLGLVLVGDGDAVAPFDQCGDVRCELGGGTPAIG